MSTRESVEADLAGDTSWRAEAARAMADEVDAGSASALAQLRGVMREIEDEGSSKAGDELDDFRRARAGRTAG